MLTYHLHSWRLGRFPVYRWLDSLGRTVGPFWHDRARATVWARETLGAPAEPFISV